MMLKNLDTEAIMLERVGRRLIDEGALSDDLLKQAHDKLQQTGGNFAESLLSLGTVKPAQLKPHIEYFLGYPFVDMAEEEIDKDIANLIPESFAVTRRVLPYKEQDNRIWVAMADPLDVDLVDNLRMRLPRAIVPCLGVASDIDSAIRRAHDTRTKARTIIDELGDTGRKSMQDEEDEVTAEDAPIVRLVQQIVSGAIAAGASDIHIEPQETDVRVRYRIDGILYDHIRIPFGHLNAMISRLKIISGLDIAERRRPQDGRFATRSDTGHGYDVRLSIMPTVYGEKAVMRLLEKANSVANLDKLGFLPAQRDVFELFIKKPHGLILVTGPTGSGKSTTLYAGLQSINSPTLNINTVEDPVEYRLPGVNQMQVNPKIGVTFATGLRTLVRQDPDVILVGEIRDRETAEISVQAALTGHLVLSTLHTNDAPGALVRLQNMGVEPFLIASAVLGVQGQRLLRTICGNCKETYTPSVEICLSAGIPLGDNGQPPVLSRGRGCSRCHNRGTKGRTAAMELVVMTDPIRHAVLAGASGKEIYDLAISEGMMTMRQAAVQKALNHQVSAEEIVRVFAQDV